MTHRSTWKQFERDVAKKFGGRRIPLSGSPGGNTGDVLHPRFHIECKLRSTRKSFTIMEDWITKNEEEARVAGKIPLLAVRHKHSNKTMIVMDMDDFINLTSPPGHPSDFNI